MKTFSKASIKTLLLALLAACTLSLHADKVKFVSGGLYQIRTVCRTDGCIMPSSYIEQAITYNIECEGNQVQSVMYLNNGENMMRSVAVDKSAWWVITKDKDGNYTICNAATNRYFTFDGQRTANRRYIYLSTGDHGDKSRWTIYAASIGLGIKNVHIPYHYLDVRLNNHIVGTYGNTSTTLHDNERFFLIDQKGRVVTEFDGEKVNLPKNCFSGNAKTRTYTGKTVRHKAPSVAVTTEVRRIQGNTQQLSFTINGIRPVFNSLSSSHLFAISESKNAKEFTGRIATTEKKGTLFVDGKKVGTGGTFRFTKPTNGHTYRLALVQNNDTVQGAWLTFTFLPVIELTTSRAVSKSSFSSATFRLLDPQHRDTDSTLTAAVRHRGDYATLFPKKAYAVKFVDATGKKQDRHFLDLRTDNYWILDAMAVDHARMRNRVAMDLWNDMDVRPYYAKGKVKTGAAAAWWKCLSTAATRASIISRNASTASSSTWRKRRKTDRAACSISRNNGAHGRSWATTAEQTGPSAASRLRSTTPAAFGTTGRANTRKWETTTKPTGHRSTTGRHSPLRQATKNLLPTWENALTSLPFATIISSSNCFTQQTTVARTCIGRWAT